MTRNNKIRLSYLGIMIFLALLFTLIGQSGANFWLMLERMDYVRIAAKIITSIALLYFIYDFVVSAKTSKYIIEFILTLLGLIAILYYLFN